jgi:hypothetical protein
MNFLITFFNIVLFGFTCLVLLTDGMSRQAVYILYTLLLLLVPILNLVVIFLGAKRNGWFSFDLKRKASEVKSKNDDFSYRGTILKTVTIISNTVLLGFSCWAFVSQYPHPNEDGFIAFVLLLLVTPILSSIAILLNRSIFRLQDLYK